MDKLKQEIKKGENQFNLSPFNLDELTQETLMKYYDLIKELERRSDDVKAAARREN